MVFVSTPTIQAGTRRESSPTSRRLTGSEWVGAIVRTRDLLPHDHPPTPRRGARALPPLAPGSSRDLPRREPPARPHRARTRRTQSANDVRLLGRYLNSEPETKRLLGLLSRAASERVVRSLARRPKSPARLTAAQNARIVELYEAGTAPVDIAREVGTSEWTVHHRLNRNGVKKRRRAQGSRRS